MPTRKTTKLENKNRCVALTFWIILALESKIPAR